MPTRAFEEVNNYLGTGDPSGGVWFIGLEEGEAWEDSSEKEIMEFYVGREFAYVTDKERAAFSIGGQKIREFMCKMVQPFSDQFKAKSWNDFHKEVLWEKGYGVFQANLYPIGKPFRNVWLPHFKTLFGFGPEDRQEYEKYVRGTRFKKISLMRQESVPQATICFGMSGWDDFKLLLNLNQSPSKELFKNVICYENEKVILTPHFANGHMSDEKTDIIKSKLKKFNVRLP